MTVFKQHAERRDNSLRPTPLTKVRALGNGPLGSLPQLNLAMRTKPIVLYSCCGLGNLAVAPGDSQRRARPARANLASEATSGAKAGPKRWRPTRAPSAARPLASCLTWATCSSISSGLRHRRYPRRRPYPNRTHPPCTCPYHPYDDASSYK